MADQAMQRLEDLLVEKIRRRTEEIRGHIWSDSTVIKDVAIAETMEHLSCREAGQLRYRRIRGDFPWGKPWSTAWFRLRLKIPSSFRDEAVHLLFDPEGEGLVFCNGQPVQGLSWSRNAYPLLKVARGSERIELYVETGANNTFGNFKKRTMHVPHIAVHNHEVWQAFWDLSSLLDMTNLAPIGIGWGLGRHQGIALHRDDPRRARIIFGLNKAVDLFDYADTGRGALRASGLRVSTALRGLYACKANASAQTIACMGHAHLDIAWLWPLDETVRKCGRTFSNVLELMERYPEFIFCQSQPHLYEMTRKHYPSLYRRIKEKAREKKWLPAGCTWVEMDCNVPGGESLVRQILFGTRFFQQEFRHKPVCLWLPDVFGYSAALPQLLRRSGVNYFLTQKISWSQFTRFPHHSFYWEGIDGSRVLSHFLPADDYNSNLDATHMITAERNYRESDRSRVQATLFGFGDGGGGPTADHLERMRRYRNLEGMPRLCPMTPKEFFTRLEKESQELPLWVGELYLENHRGTYTTRGRTKKYNRRAEFLLRDTELLATIAPAAGRAFPHKVLHDAWKTVLLNQFHDILPGSSIDRVYDESDKQYREVLATVGDLRDKAMSRLVSSVDTSGPGRAVLVLNSLSWERRDIACARIPGLRRGGRHVAVSPSGSRTPVQICADGQARFAAQTQPMGYSVYHIRPAREQSESANLSASTRMIENDVVRVRFDTRGRVTGILDKRLNREVITRGAKANQFILFEDKTASCGPAWDTEIFYNDKLLQLDGELVSSEVIEPGPVRAAVKFVRRMSKSTITQDVILCAGSPRVDFATTVEWGDENNVLLKVAFPVAVRSDKARYEIQFGNVERPTHWNTPQDFARFEVPAQKWADMSEGDYGVALLNDCKYGYDTKGSVMRLTLLRASRSPGGNVDTNTTHRFTYSLLPHAGDFRTGVVRNGYELNVPLIAQPAKPAGGTLPAESSFFSITGENVVIDTVKKAEEGNGIIVRMYEAHGCRGQRTFRTSLPVKCAAETDLLEHEERRLTVRDRAIRLTFGPYQIRTVKLDLQ